MHQFLQLRKSIRQQDVGFTEQKLKADAREIIGSVSLAVSEGDFDSLREFTDEQELARLKSRYEELNDHERKFARIRPAEIAEVNWVSAFVNEQDCNVAFGMRAFGYHWIGGRQLRTRNFFSAYYELQRPMCEVSERYRVLSARHMHGHFNFLI